MPRILHGEILPLEPEEVEKHRERLAGAPAPQALDSESWPFGYLFPELQCDRANYLPTSDETVTNLKKLGGKGAPGTTAIMEDRPAEVPGVPVPTAYTFFAQFVDHDITFEKAPDRIRDLADLTPLTSCQVRELIVNVRSPNLELDSVYSPTVPRNGEKLLLGRVSLPNGLPHGKDEYNDLPRGPKSPDLRYDRVALIGDPRNDENLIVAQLHVAFLRAHNALIDRGYRFEEARTLIRQHYQWIVLNDFLGRVADPAIVKRINNQGPVFFKPTRESFFTPLEFSAAAYRFGHSKIREAYNDYNYAQASATLLQLFMFTRFSGDGGGADLDQIPGNWVIDWTNFFNTDKSDFFARPIDTMLSPMLFNLQQPGALPMRGESSLAARNLLRGYVLSLPTGQAVAKVMHDKSNGIIPLTEDQVASVAANEEQLKVLKDSGFLKNTPLWFYILAEAAYYSRGHHLGPVGSTIVAEVLIGILRYSDDSILSNPYWVPTLGTTPNKFDLKDFLRLANVL